MARYELLYDIGARARITVEAGSLKEAAAKADKLGIDSFDIEPMADGWELYWAQNLDTGKEIRVEDGEEED